MTEPMNDFEQRLAEDLRRLTDAAPGRLDFAEQARLLAARPPERRPRWRRVMPIALGTAALAAGLTLAVVELGPIHRGPSASGSAAATPSPSVSASPVQSVSPVPSPSTAPAAEIDLSKLAWFDLTDMVFGTVTEMPPEATPLPTPFGQLQVGTLDGHLAAEVHLEEESFANGPYPAGVLAGQDNGSRSELLLVSPLSGAVRTLFQTDALVPIAALSPDDAWIYYPKIDRKSGQDTGVWRRPIGDGPEERVIDPGIASVPEDYASAWFMGWTPHGKRLVVQACNRGQCTASVCGPVQDRTTRLSDQTGEFLGLTDTDLVTRRARAPGVVAVDLDSGTTRTIEPATSGGAIARGASGWFLAYEPDVGPVRAYRLEAIPFEGGGPHVLVSLSGSDLSLAAVSAPGDRRAILPNGWVLRWPVRGSPYADIPFDPATWFAGQLVNVETGETLKVPPVADALPRPDCAPIPPAELPSGAAAGLARITDATGYRFATWGQGADLVTEIVGATLYTTNAGPQTMSVAIRGTTGKLFQTVIPDGPYVLSWQESGCMYELWLPLGLSKSESADYAARY